MIGENAVPPIPPRLVIVNVPPRISSIASLPVRAFSARAAISPARSRMLFLLGVADDGHHETAVGVDGDADVEVLLKYNFAGHQVERCVEIRKFAQGRDDGLDGQHGHRDLWRAFGQSSPRCACGRLRDR